MAPFQAFLRRRSKGKHDEAEINAQAVKPMRTRSSSPIKIRFFGGQRQAAKDAESVELRAIDERTDDMERMVELFDERDEEDIDERKPDETEPFPEVGQEVTSRDEADIISLLRERNVSNEVIGLVTSEMDKNHQREYWYPDTVPTESESQHSSFKNEAFAQKFSVLRALFRAADPDPDNLLEKASKEFVLNSQENTDDSLIPQSLAESWQALVDYVNQKIGQEAASEKPADNSDDSNQVRQTSEIESEPAHCEVKTHDAATEGEPAEDDVKPYPPSPAEKMVSHISPNWETVQEYIRLVDLESTNLVEKMSSMNETLCSDVPTMEKLRHIRELADFDCGHIGALADYDLRRDLIKLSGGHPLMMSCADPNQVVEGSWSKGAKDGDLKYLSKVEAEENDDVFANIEDDILRSPKSFPGGYQRSKLDKECASEHFTTETEAGDEEMNAEDEAGDDLFDKNFEQQQVEQKLTRQESLTFTPLPDFIKFRSIPPVNKQGQIDPAFDHFIQSKLKEGLKKNRNLPPRPIEGEIQIQKMESLEMQLTCSGSSVNDGIVRVSTAESSVLAKPERDFAKTIAELAIKGGSTVRVIGKECGYVCCGSNNHNY